MPSSARKSLVLSLRNAYEALAVAVPTVVDAGRENLRGSGSAAGGLDAESGSRTFVVMSNHQSHYDVLGGLMRLVAKTELFNVPLFGRAIRDAGMIEVDRGNRARGVASLASAEKQLEAGVHFWIAPEGTRSDSGELMPFEKGAFVLALDMGAPILPISIEGTRDVLPSHGMLSRRGVEVHVTIHPPIETAPFAARSGDVAATKAARDTLMTDVRMAIAGAL